ncbi:hypothetical protein V6N13_047631 [Hibiscus sabdariffa]|uniref:Uncharacterized protein n=1 Tax=Hibiscus sabdariffa TaxID=183260 RepID=A0ABR2F4S8_9ROSI
METRKPVEHGAGLGIPSTSDTVLAHLWAAATTLRAADGADQVHFGTIAQPSELHFFDVSFIAFFFGIH